MGIGDPVTKPFHSDIFIQSQCSLGVDFHSNNSASMVSEMWLLLQSARRAHNAKHLGKGVAAKDVYHTVVEAFTIGTINGARAINIEDEVGSLVVGKVANIIFFDALNSSMVCGAQHVPFAANVLHSSPANIEMVFADGSIRKRYWMLESVNTKLRKDIWDGEERDTLAWRDVAKELVEKRKGTHEQIEKIDMDNAREEVIKASYLDKTKIVDTI